MASEVYKSNNGARSNASNAVRGGLRGSSAINKRKALEGWNTTNAPKNQSVKVVDWLRGNDFFVSKSENQTLGSATFRDVIKGRVDYSGVETFIRDAIYDASNSLKRKK